MSKKSNKTVNKKMDKTVNKKTSKKARKEGNRVAQLIKANKTEFYIADVDLEDETKDVIDSITCTIKTLGKARAAFMLVSAGTKTLTVACYVPDELVDKIDSKEWLSKALVGINNDGITQDETSNNTFYVSVDIELPFKLKDMVRGNGFAYLKKLGLMADAEDESSEEFIGFDDF